jgi:cytidylate kinase
MKMQSTRTETNSETILKLEINNLSEENQRLKFKIDQLLKEVKQNSNLFLEFRHEIHHL